MDKEPKVDILLVDDRPDGLLALEAVLSSPEYNLIQARSGEEALAQMACHEIAVVLLDVQMPVMDGFQTAAQMKQNSQWKDIPILFVTAIHKDIPNIHEGYKMGAVDYIFKPFDPYILQSKVAVLVDLFRKTNRIRETQEELRRKEEELHQTRKLEAIGRLAGGVAHDFNNLIAGILGISQELQESFDANDSRREDLNEIIKAAHRAFSLTRQLLAYARRQIISPKVLNLNIIVTDMQELLGRLIGEDIQLETVLEPFLGAVNADRGYLEQVLVNLVLNARDAMPKGGRIKIETTNVDLTSDIVQKNALELNTGLYVKLTVSDNGTGMSQETLDHVFEPFFTTKEKGTGLGLATVYGIVKQNGGDIAVRSRKETGTVMDIYFPRVARETSIDTDTVGTNLPPATETVLVVEDENLVRRVVTSILRKKGYQVLEARNGREALELCEHRTDPIDLLITDVIMPEINGKQLADSIVALHPETTVLFMSGYTHDVIAHRGVLEPGIAFIEKSDISNHLAGKVRQVLSARKDTSRPLERPPAAPPVPS